MAYATGDQSFYWCVKHSRVESGDGVCPSRRLLGPYPSREAAENALETVRRRNERWDAEDARWEGG